MPRKRRPLSLEMLECRRMLAVFGTPWPEPRSLTLSFPGDGAPIGGHANVSRLVLDQVADRREWQEAVLRAFQTWAIETNLNIGLTADRGNAFGAVGLAQGDPRFGDFRVGAFPQDGVLANALPYQSRSGTWAGDVLFNSDTNFFLADWEDPDFPITGPDPNEWEIEVDLFSVALHEAGNALGLPDVNQPVSVMHHTYLGPKGQLTSSDIDQIRGLYGGPRQDPYEQQSNDSLMASTAIEGLSPTSESRMATVRGSLNSIEDVDYYRFSPEPDHNEVTVRLRASGISLVKAQLSVLDAYGEVLDQTEADSIFENDLSLEIGSLKDHSELFIRIASNSDDVFGVGDYRLELDWRAPDEQPSLETVDFDQEYSPLYQNLDDDDDYDDDAIFNRVGLVDPELGENDSIGTATALETPLGYLSGTRFEGLGSIHGNDVDFWRFRASGDPSDPMQIRVDRLGYSLNRFQADLLDAGGNRVNARVTLDRDGSVTFLVDERNVGSDYFVRVRFAADETDRGPINYFVAVDVATNDQTAAELLRGQTNISEPTWSTLRVGKTQLFRFELSAGGNDSDQGVAISVYDPRTAAIVFSMTVRAGFRNTIFAWLSRGDYYVRVTSIARSTVVPQSLEFRLDGVGISDDQGPRPIDPCNPSSSGQCSDPHTVGNPLTSIEPVANPFVLPPFPSNTAESESSVSENPYSYLWFFDPYYAFYMGI
jgi:hypothetical protein